MKGPLTNVDIPDGVTLSQFVLNRLSETADDVVLVDGPSGHQWTGNELMSQIKNVAAGLYGDFRVGQGVVVCLMLPNIPEFVIILYGVLETGATATTCNPNYTKDELRYQLEDCRPSLIFTIKENVEKVQMARQGIHGCEHIIVVGDDGKELLPSVSDLIHSRHCIDLPKVEIKPREDSALLLYSSGTTGKPKGVMLTHYNCIANLALFSHPDLKLGSPSDVYLAFIPFFHVYGINVILNVGLCLRAKVVTMPRFHPERFLEYIEKYKVSVLHIAPPTALFLADSPLVDDYDTSSVRTVICGAAPLSRTIGLKLKERLGVRDLRQGYGMTEAGPGVLIGLPGEQEVETIGCPMSNTEVKVIDPSSGITLGQTQTGEICVRGPQVMKGYLHNPEATAFTVDSEGWLHTGDLGYCDTTGNFYLVDRLKELIKYKGFQVAPAELEAVLLSHPAIADAAVVGKPDSVAGELPTAFVVVKHPYLSPTSHQIQDFVAEKVTDYKRLRGGVMFINAVPKSPSGKILRRLLRNRAINKL